MAVKKQFPTPAMLEAQKKLANRTPEQIAADKKAAREELLRYYGDEEGFRRHIDRLAKENKE